MKMNSIKLCVRDLSDCIEFPIWPVEPEKNQEIRGHICFPPRGRSHDLVYVEGQMARLIDIGIKEITIHTAGINLTKLVEIADFANYQRIALNIENRRDGRTSRIKNLEKILWATEAGLTLDVGHTEANGNTEEYIREFGDLIRNAHLYRIETAKGHQPFEDYADFKELAKKLFFLENLNWVVVEVNQVNQIVKWWERSLKELEKIQKDAINDAGTYLEDM